MHRNYEDPWELENQLKERKQEYREAKENNADEDTIIDLSIEIASLEERINFAWQDDECENGF